MKSILRTAFLLLGATLAGCVTEPTVAYRIRTTEAPVTQDQVLRLTHAGISDAVVLEEIRNRGVDAHPGADQIVSLKQAGVSDAVIQALNSAQIRTEQQVVEVAGYPYVYPYYYYPYYPYPYGPYWYGGPYWYHYPYHPYYPYYAGHYSSAPYSVHHYRH